MTTMQLSWSSRQSRDKVYDPIRKSWVAALPEEIVRQKLLQKMLQLGYPKTLIAVEKELKELPHLSRTKQLPERRIDILCFAQVVDQKNFLAPLLLIECKGDLLGDKALEQIQGYNGYVKAPFLAIAGADKFEMIFLNNGVQHSVPFLPSYTELVNAIRSTFPRR